MKTARHGSYLGATRAALALLGALSSCGATSESTSNPSRARDERGAQRAPSAGLARETVEAHNSVRARFGTPALRWSDSLAAQARDWAGHLCTRARGGRAVLEHRPNNNHGENIFWQGGGDPPAVSAAIRSWADEERFYDARSGQCRGGQCGHFTQVVWRGTTDVGCGEANCGEHHFWVCNYDPPGNWVGQRAY